MAVESPRGIGVIALGALLCCVACATGSAGPSSTGPSSAAATGTSATSTGGAAATSTGSGGSTTSGAPDAGCPVGSPAGLPQGSACLFEFDCACGLLCGAAVSGSPGALVCEIPCGADDDCPLPNEHCQTTLGFCQGGLVGSCDRDGGPNLEFDACQTNADCPCPLECYGDPVLGPVCEAPCNGAGCPGTNEHCNLEIGSCERACSNSGLATEFQLCQEATDCRCPFRCTRDERRGLVCER